MMKPRNRAISLILALMLVCGAAFAETAEETAFRFRNGVTWDTPAGMIAIAEGVTEESKIFTMPGEGFIAYVLQGRDFMDHAVTVAYYYKQGRLVAAGYFFAPDPAATFDTCLALFTPVYGEPAEADGKTAAALFNAVSPGALAEEEIAQIAAWLLSDGTRVYLLNLDGEMCFFCFNEPVLIPNGTV